jgi:3-hydroxyacyl-CoA dehydrogenase
MPVMPAVVSSALDGNVAVVTIDNPPVNALGHAVRAGLVEALDAAKANAAVEAIVIACAGRTFCAGADITEFGKPPRSPILQDVINTIESIEKPVIAAVHGTTLGGGLELALACHLRIAAPTTRLGLPEVKLGILPGAGGTQRLPRVIGPVKAVERIVTGEPMSAAEALADGLVQEIAEEDLVQSAISLARAAVAIGKPIPLVRDRDDKLAPVRADRGEFDAKVASLLARRRNQDAPAACAKSVSNALELPFDEAIAAERALFLKLVAGDQSKALRHVFFAEREAARIPGLGADIKPRAIAGAAVIGAGTMGGGIAMCFANAGLPVTLIDTTQEAVARGRAVIEANYQNTVKRGGLTADQAARRLGLITTSTDLQAAASADIVVEAVFEEMEIKRKLFAIVDRVAKPGAVLATNTSTLDVNAIAAVTGRPGDVLGMHFFSPANVMRLLEVVRGKATAADALATAMAIGRRIGKVPVVSGVCDGFIGNRMLAKRSTEAESLLIEGADPMAVDAAVVGFGFPMGPYAMSDLAGLDVSWRIRKARGAKAPVSDALCEAGRFGQKTGKGYFLYEPGSRTPKSDPEVTKLIEDTSRRLGIKRREVGTQEILERMLYPMINEAARILEEGIALRPGDIDVVWVYGYGWPAWRGGPMHFADADGLGKIASRLTAYAMLTGDKSMAPAPLLAKLATEGKGFASLATGGRNAGP